jgi:hypothetical protein
VLSWRATAISAGTPVSLAPAVLASVAQALRRPAGFASSAALRPWVRQTPGGEVTDQTPDVLVRPRFNTKRNVARPRRAKNP